MKQIVRLFALGVVLASTPAISETGIDFQRAAKCVELGTVIGSSIRDVNWVVLSLKSEKTRDEVLTADHFRDVLSRSVDVETTWSSGTAIQFFEVLGLDQAVDTALDKAMKIDELKNLSPALGQCATGAECNSGQALTDILIAPLMQGSTAVRFALKNRDFTFEDEPEKSLALAGQFAGLLVRSCSALLKDN